MIDYSFFDGLDIEDLHYQARSNGTELSTLTEAENTVLNAFLAEARAAGWSTHDTPLSVWQPDYGLEIIITHLDKSEGHVWWSLDNRELLTRLIERGRVTLGVQGKPILLRPAPPALIVPYDEDFI